MRIDWGSQQGATVLSRGGFDSRQRDSGTYPCGATLAAPQTRQGSCVIGLEPIAASPVAAVPTSCRRGFAAAAGLAAPADFPAGAAALPPAAGAVPSAAAVVSASSLAFFFFFLPTAEMTTRTFGRPSGLRPSCHRSSALQHGHAFFALEHVAGTGQASFAPQTLVDRHVMTPNRWRFSAFCGFCKRTMYAMRPGTFNRSKTGPSGCSEGTRRHG